MTAWSATPTRLYVRTNQCTFTLFDFHRWFPCVVIGFFGHLCAYRPVIISMNFSQINGVLESKCQFNRVNRCIATSHQCSCTFIRAESDIAAGATAIVVALRNKTYNSGGDQLLWRDLLPMTARSATPTRLYLCTNRCTFTFLTLIANFLVLL